MHSDDQLLSELLVNAGRVDSDAVDQLISQLGDRRLGPCLVESGVLRQDELVQIVNNSRPRFEDADSMMSAALGDWLGRAATLVRGARSSGVSRLQARRRFGKYEIVREVAEGGMGLSTKRSTSSSIGGSRSR